MDKIKDFFLRSETILVARAQVALGIVMAAFVALDPQLVLPYLSPKWAPVYMLAAGIITEIARRRNDPALTDKHADDQDVRGI